MNWLMYEIENDWIGATSSWLIDGGMIFLITTKKGKIILVNE